MKREDYVPSKELQDIIKREKATETMLKRSLDDEIMFRQNIQTFNNYIEYLMNQ